ncbi:MAG: hypothetical protein FAZ92_02735 [Accumulibacter sp.]|nr:MAG: hypothetical protein FAZ92_02735 [Accumulibacter sp.]
MAGIRVRHRVIVDINGCTDLETGSRTHDGVLQREIVRDDLDDFVDFGGDAERLQGQPDDRDVRGRDEEVGAPARFDGRLDGRRDVRGVSDQSTRCADALDGDGLVDQQAQWVATRIGVVGRVVVGALVIGARSDEDGVAVGSRVDGCLEAAVAAVADEQELARTAAVDDLDRGKRVGTFGARRDIPAAATIAGDTGSGQSASVERGVDARATVDRVAAAASEEGVIAVAAGELVVQTGAFGCVGVDTTAPFHGRCATADVFDVVDSRIADNSDADARAAERVAGPERDIRAVILVVANGDTMGVVAERIPRQRRIRARTVKGCYLHTGGRRSIDRGNPQAIGKRIVRDRGRSAAANLDAVVQMVAGTLASVGVVREGAFDLRPEEEHAYAADAVEHGIGHADRLRGAAAEYRDGGTHVGATARLVLDVREVDLVEGAVTLVPNALPDLVAVAIHGKLAHAERHVGADHEHATCVARSPGIRDRLDDRVVHPGAKDGQVVRDDDLRGTGIAKGERTGRQHDRVVGLRRGHGFFDRREAAVADEQNPSPGVLNDLDVREGVVALGAAGNSPAGAVGGDVGSSQCIGVAGRVGAGATVDGVASSATDDEVRAVPTDHGVCGRVTGDDVGQPVAGDVDRGGAGERDRGDGGTQLQRHAGDAVPAAHGQVVVSDSESALRTVVARRNVHDIAWNGRRQRTGDGRVGALDGRAATQAGRGGAFQHHDRVGVKRLE